MWDAYDYHVFGIDLSGFDLDDIATQSRKQFDFIRKLVHKTLVLLDKRIQKRRASDSLGG